MSDVDGRSRAGVRCGSDRLHIATEANPDDSGTRMRQNDGSCSSL